MNIPFFPNSENIFDLTSAQLILMRWILFYESIYELDEVERPSEKIINDDEKLDLWYENYRSYVRKELIEYHKRRKTPNVDTGIPKPTYSFGA